jgi:hypothetical protein
MLARREMLKILKDAGVEQKAPIIQVGPRFNP